jgi:hypothetical protein
MRWKKSDNLSPIMKAAFRNQQLKMHTRSLLSLILYFLSIIGSLFHFNYILGFRCSYELRAGFFSHVYKLTKSKIVIDVYREAKISQRFYFYHHYLRQKCKIKLKATIYLPCSTSMLRTGDIIYIIIYALLLLLLVL